MESTVIVTGASGFVGRSVLRSAPRWPGCTMIPVTREGASEAVADAARRHPERTLNVLNLAWPRMGSYASTNRSTSVEAAEWNAYKTWIGDLAAAATAAGARFFGVGSGIEPYALGERPALGEPYITYARHKSEIRDILARTPGLRATWLRPHFLYGPHEAASRIIPTALRACRDGTPIEISALERRRHWLHVEDAAHGLVQAVLSDAPEDWDIAGESAFSFREIIGLVETVVGQPLLLRPTAAMTADSNCLYIAPVNPPSFLAGAIGSALWFSKRLKEYMMWINQQDE